MSGQPGRSGRRKKPAIVKKREGNRGKRKIQDETLAIGGAPVLPPYFDAVQTHIWHQTIGALPPGLLTAAEDQVCIERFVVGWSQFREATHQIAQTGLLVRGETGPIRNPLLPVQKAAAAMMDRAGADIGSFGRQDADRQPC